MFLGSKSTMDPADMKIRCMCTIVLFPFATL